MQITLNKIAAGVVGFAMVAGLALAFTATKANAAELSLSDLVELFIGLGIIDESKAEDARAAVEDMGDKGTTPAAMSCNFTRNLKTGDTGADVKDLQKLLNGKGYTVAATGVGSAGNETEYYGPATAAAVAKMQEAFAAEILAPLGLTKGTGFFGTATRAKANTLCAAADDSDDADTDEDADEDEDTDLSGGEASLEDFDASSEPSDEEIEENTEDNEVYGFEFEVEDGDVEINRIDVRFEMTGTSAEDEPWNVFENVKLMSGDEEVASIATDDEDAWGNETGDAWSLRFTDLDVVVEEGEMAEFVVAVDVMNQDDSDIDGADEMEWSVWVENDGVRATDGAGLDQYIGDADLLADADHEETFTVEAAGGDTELRLSTATENPKSSIIRVEENDRSDEVATLVMDVEAKDGEVTLNKLVFFATTSDEDLIDVISDITLDIDGNTFTDWYYAETAAGAADADPDESGYIVFDLEDEDDEFLLEEDEEVTVKLLVEFKQVSGNYAEGTTVEFDVATTERDEWLADDVNGDDLDDATGKSGTGNGEMHQLLSEGIFAEIASITETKTAGESNANDVGDYVFKIDVTAFEDTFYMSSTSAAVNFHLEDGDGNTVTVGTTTSALTSTASKDTNYRIDDGDTETFTFTVTINPSAGEGSDYYRVVVDSIDYGTAPLTPTGEVHTVSPAEDFESDVLYLNA